MIDTRSLDRAESTSDDDQYSAGSVAVTTLEKDTHDGGMSADADHGPEDEKRGKAKAPRRLSVSLRGFVIGLIFLLLAATASVFGWLYAGARDHVSAQEAAAANRTHAEETASNYAVQAAEMDYQDFNAWKLKLVNGTSPELKDKLTKAADTMQQILTPLQWKSTARPLAAKVRSDSGGVYVVDAFVSVLTKTMQAPDGLQSTATYSVTLDSKNNWQITDVGGIDAALGK